MPSIISSQTGLSATSPYQVASTPAQSGNTSFVARPDRNPIDNLLTAPERNLDPNQIRQLIRQNHGRLDIVVFDMDPPSEYSHSRDLQNKLQRDLQKKLPANLRNKVDIHIIKASDGKNLDMAGLQQLKNLIAQGKAHLIITGADTKHDLSLKQINKYSGNHFTSGEQVTKAALQKAWDVYFQQNPKAADYARQISEIAKQRPFVSAVGNYNGYGKTGDPIDIGRAQFFAQPGTIKVAAGQSGRTHLGQISDVTISRPDRFSSYAAETEGAAIAAYLLEG